MARMISAVGVAVGHLAFSLPAAAVSACHGHRRSGVPPGVKSNRSLSVQTSMPMSAIGT